jgi:NADH-ubiquinone oxidoreductase chain 5
MFLFFGAIGKSAQLGLHTWLPDAMEGPTPVSALIHAATMVTAGVFLIIRCSHLFSASPATCTFMAFIGILTAVVSGTIGLLQYDIKKIIAYSTCSQLGYMVFGCGLYHFSISFFHLINHAFFKALLFLSAGAIIHALNDEQDIRKMGGLVNVLPFVYTVVLIGSLALMGVPFLTGFYSKDLLLEMTYNTQNFVSQYCFWMGIFGAGMTAYYSFRLIYYVFITPANGFKIVYKQIHEPGPAITIVLFILAVSSIFFGYYLSEMFASEGTLFLSTSIITPNVNNTYDIPFSIPIFYKFLPFFTSVYGALLAMFLPRYFNKLLVDLELYNFFSRSIFILFNKKWFFDFAYNKIGYVLLNLSYYLSYEFFDKGLLELFGPLGLINVVNYTGYFISRIQNGLLTNGLQMLMFGFYLFLTSVGLVI